MPNIAHEFDPNVAVVYGVNAAVLFQHICYLSQESPSRWVNLTLQELCTKYPYLGRKAIWRALQVLVKPGRKTPPLVLRKGTQAGTGHLYAPVPKDGFCENPHKFDIALAGKLGVVPAIIYRNVRYFVQKNWMIRAETLYDRLDPDTFHLDNIAMWTFAYDNTIKAAAHFTTVEQWVKHRPYVALRSAERAFNCLLEEGLLLRTYLKNKVPLWHLPAKTLFCFKRNLLSSCTLENSAAKRKLSPPKGNSCRQKETDAAKRKRGLGSQVTEPESDDGNPASVLSHSYEDNLASQKAALSITPAHPSEASAFANAHADAPAVMTQEALRELRSEFKDMNQPTPPKAEKKKKAPDTWMGKRKYVKKVRDDAGFGELNDE